MFTYEPKKSLKDVLVVFQKICIIGRVDTFVFDSSSDYSGATFSAVAPLILILQ